MKRSQTGGVLSVLNFCFLKLVQETPGSSQFIPKNQSLLCHISCFFKHPRLDKGILGGICCFQELMVRRNTYQPPNPPKLQPCNKIPKQHINQFNSIFIQIYSTSARPRSHPSVPSVDLQPRAHLRSRGLASRRQRTPSPRRRQSWRLWFG